MHPPNPAPAWRAPITPGAASIACHMLDIGGKQSHCTDRERRQTSAPQAVPGGATDPTTDNRRKTFIFCCQYEFALSESVS